MKKIRPATRLGFSVDKPLTMNKYDMSLFSEKFR
ncbi:unnamed protein product [Schistosoma curassoni]|nr:unnamed protein product [Schistosoma curassoni]